MASVTAPTSFSRLLVANRGEVALRVMRSARALGLSTVAVYSDADASGRHVIEADDAVRLGPAPARASYLNIEAVLEAARSSGAQAVHPGYGFLSENATFARAVIGAGLTFVGPPPDVIELMGRKELAREAARDVGLSVLSAQLVGDGADDETAVPEGVTFPLLVKAVAGGGGKGMRIVRSPAEFADGLVAARREALSAFGDASVLIERYIEGGHHIEVQVLADAHGNVVHLGERDCSAQRRHQKVIEEAPAPFISERVRTRILDDAVRLARAVGYVGAGTVEFLVHGEDAYFLEMNTRLQVEHPVTEEICGMDIVALQLAVADGQVLPFTQADVGFAGHAIEVRVYAEDAAAGFLPQAGQVVDCRWGPDVRVETALCAGLQVGTTYDPMLAKVIAHGPTREVARQRLLRGLQRSGILGVTTNIGFLQALLSSPAFIAGDVHTRWLDDMPGETWGDSALRGGRLAHDVPPAALAAMIGAWDLAGRPGAPATHRPAQPFADRSGWRMGADPVATAIQLTARAGTWRIRVHPDTANVGAARIETDEGSWMVRQIDPGGLWLMLDVSGRIVQCGISRADGMRPESIDVVVDGLRFVFVAGTKARDLTHGMSSDGLVVSPMPGQVVEVRVAQGAIVSAGDVLGVLEAMKMEMPLRAPFDGTVTSVTAAVGQQVALGEVLFAIEPLVATKGAGDDD